MSNEYPREAELSRIKEWDILKKPIKELLEYILPIWKYEDRFVLTGKRVLRLYLSTGGWSGNEDIIAALKQNFLFWSLCWVKSIRGGHYWFRIPPPFTQGDMKVGASINNEPVNRPATRTTARVLLACNGEG